MPGQRKSYENDRKHREKAFAAGKFPILGLPIEQCPSLDKECMQAFEAILVAQAKWMRAEIDFCLNKSAIKG